MIHWFKKHFFPHHDNDHHPHLLRHQSILAVMAVAILLESVIIFGSFFLPRLGLEMAAVLPSVVTFLTNNARAQDHLPEVKISDVLATAAQAKADDMAAKGYFSHVSPDGTEPWYWFEQAGYEYQYAGENLAVNFSDSEELVRAWQNSPTHNMNLLGPRYTETGVGMAVGNYQGREAVFVVQFFAAPLNNRAVSEGPVDVEPWGEGVPIVSRSSEPEVLSSETKAVPSPSVLSRIASAPRTYAIYSLIILASLFSLVILSGLGRHHPHALAGGVVVIGMFAGLIYVHKLIPLRGPDLPQSPEHAATVFYALAE